MSQEHNRRSLSVLYVRHVTRTVTWRHRSVLLPRRKRRERSVYTRHSAASIVVRQFKFARCSRWQRRRTTILEGGREVSAAEIGTEDD